MGRGFDEITKSLGKTRKNNGFAVNKINKEDGSIEWRKENGDLHREDGPAIVYMDGSEEYWIDGKRHREDGPAIISLRDGVREYWMNDKRHREDGPALINPEDSREEYWIDGKRHREDGPAVIYRDKSDLHAMPETIEEYWVDGKRHREDGPAVDRYDIEKIEYWIDDDLREDKLNESVTFDNIEWRNKGGRGDLHREDGPALIHRNGTIEYYQNGKRHREDGPAVIRPDGVKAYYQNGKLHREDGPAIDSPDPKEAQYWRNGKLHREDGPALTLGMSSVSRYDHFEYGPLEYPRPQQTSEFLGSPAFYKVRSKATMPYHYDMPGIQFYFSEGELHREDGPAVVWPNGRGEYYKNGLLHREDGPARMHSDGTIEYWREGKLNREEGPAIIHSDGTEEYWRDGERHREDGPAVVFSDPNTSKIVEDLFYEKGTPATVMGPSDRYTPAMRDRLRGGERWYRNGKLSREDGPAVIRKNGTKEWRKDGELHREDGPAFIGSDGIEEYWVNGKDPYDQSAWRVDGEGFNLLERLKKSLKFSRKA